jgi:diketogulonate reductase-like aldo/keto reductase
LDYLDLYLVHIPLPVVDGADGKPHPARQGFGLQDTWREMEKIYENGWAKAIGVSNYTVLILNDALNYGKIPPMVNQFERHPYLAQHEMIKFCKDNNVQAEAYSSLGAPGLDRQKEMPSPLDDPVVKKIAEKHNKSPAQVLLRWSHEQDVVIIPKSVTPKRILENSQIFDFKLTADEIKEIDHLDKRLRSFAQDWMGCPTFF